MLRIGVTYSPPVSPAEEATAAVAATAAAAVVVGVTCLPMPATLLGNGERPLPNVGIPEDVPPEASEYAIA